MQIQTNAIINTNTIHDQLKNTNIKEIFKNTSSSMKIEYKYKYKQNKITKYKYNMQSKINYKYKTVLLKYKCELYKIYMTVQTIKYKYKFEV